MLEFLPSVFSVGEGERPLGGAVSHPSGETSATYGSYRPLVVYPVAEGTLHRVDVRGLSSADGPVEENLDGPLFRSAGTQPVNILLIIPAHKRGDDRQNQSVS